MLLQDLSGNSYMLKKNEAYTMEIELNKSPYGHKWSEIGDKLYNYATNKKEIKTLTITSIQFGYLIQLLINHNKRNSKEELFKHIKIN